MRRADSLEKTLMLAKTEGKRRRGDRGQDGWMIIDSMDVTLSKLQEIAKDGEAWCAAVHRVIRNPTRLSNLLISNKFVCDLVLGNNELTAKIKSFF